MLKPTYFNTYEIIKGHGLKIMLLFHTYVQCIVKIDRKIHIVINF